MVTAIAVIGEVIPLRDRGRYQGALGAVFGVTTVIGPLLGGFFTDHLTWRWAFWINVPVAVVVLMVAAVAIPPLARSAAKPAIDYAGILFVGLGASGLTLATSWGGTEYAWTSPMIIGLFVGFAGRTRHLHLGRDAGQPSRSCRSDCSAARSSRCAACWAFIVGFAMLGALTFLPTFMQFVDGVSATESGLRTLPMVVGPADHVDRQRCDRRPHRPLQDLPGGRAPRSWRWPSCCCRGWTPTRPTWQQSLYLFILGTGIGSVHAGADPDRAEHRELRRSRRRHLGRDVLPHHRQFVRRGDLRLAVHQLPRRTASARRWPPVGAPPEAAQSPKALHQLSPEMAAPIVDAYADSLGKVFLCAAPVALVGFVVALFLKEVPLRETRRDLGDRPRRGLRHAHDRVAGEDARDGGRPDVPRLPGDPVAQPRRASRAASSTSRGCGR